MYTAKILRKSADKQSKLLFIDVAYHLDGATEPEATEQIRFSIESSLQDIARKIKSEITRLEKYDTNIASITEGDVDLSIVVDTTPTQVELDRQEWFRDFNRLENVQKLITFGALVGTEAPVVALRKRVKDNFKPAYIADM